MELKRGAEGRAPARNPKKPQEELYLEGDQMVLHVFDLVVSFLFSSSFFLWEHGSWHDVPGKKERATKKAIILS